MRMMARSRSFSETKEYSRPPVYWVKTSAGLSTKIALACLKISTNTGMKLAELEMPDTV